MVKQIIRTVNPDGSITVTVITEKDNVGIDTARNECYLEAAIKSATEKALSKD